MDGDNDDDDGNRSTEVVYDDDSTFPDFSNLFQSFQLLVLRLLGPGIRPNGANTVRRRFQFNIQDITCLGDLLTCQKQITF